MPSLQSALYNGFNLVRGDNDKKSQWQGTIHKGVTGSHVADLQKHLKLLGVYEFNIDGQFGGRTEIVVKRFQWNVTYSEYRLYRNGLIKVKSIPTISLTGIVQTLTRKEIDFWINLPRKENHFRYTRRGSSGSSQVWRTLSVIRRDLGRIWQKR